MDAKICNEVMSAINLGAKVINLELARRIGWKKLQAAAANGEQHVIVDTVKHNGIPIRALVTPHVDPTTNKIMCLTTCQECAIGVPRAAQDVWQSAYCDEHSGSKGTGRGTGKKREKKKTEDIKYVAARAKAIKEMIDTGYQFADVGLSVDDLKSELRQQETTDAEANAEAVESPKMKAAFVLLAKVDEETEKL